MGYINVSVQQRRSYYSKKIAPTLDNLNLIDTVLSQFHIDGEGRLIAALSSRNMDLGEVDRMSIYINEALCKMEREVKCLEKFAKTFNQEFATNHNNHFDTVSRILQKIRSHMAPLKEIMQRFCPRKHPTSQQCAIYDIKSKSVFESSLLGTAPYSPDLFDISSFPPEVKGLFDEMLRFFNAEAKCMQICQEVLQEEKNIREDPQASQGLLDKLRGQIYDVLACTTQFCNKHAVDALKSQNPAYNSRKTYATETSFAQGEFHKHSTDDMTQYFLIELMTSEGDITIEERSLWGDDTEAISKIRLVIEHFDELVPSVSKEKPIGLYEYIFCQWATSTKGIKNVLDYFTDHYHGKYKLSKYGAVNKQASKYDKNSEIAKNFHDNINSLFNGDTTPNCVTYTA